MHSVVKTEGIFFQGLLLEVIKKMDNIKLNHNVFVKFDKI